MWIVSLTATLFLPHLATGGPVETVRLQFAPAQGTSLEKSFRVTSSMESEELTSKMGGQPIPQQFLPELDVYFETELEVRVRDRFERVEDARVTELVRHFEVLEGRSATQVSMPPEPEHTEDFEREHELTGQTVVFTWDPEDEDYDRRLEDSEEIHEDLDSLDVDMDLLGFLPEEAVEIGDSWKVPAEAVAALFHPGGDIGLDSSEEEDETYELLSTSSELQVQLVRVQREEEGRLAVLSVAGEYTEAYSRPTDLEQVPVADGRATETLSSTYDIEGELVWSLSAGHAVSLELESTFEALVETVRDEDQPGPAFSSALSFYGERSFSASFEPVEE